MFGVVKVVSWAKENWRCAGFKRIAKSLWVSDSYSCLLLSTSSQVGGSSWTCTLTFTALPPLHLSLWLWMTGVADPVKQVGRDCQEISCDTPWTEWRWKRDRQIKKERNVVNAQKKEQFYWMHVTWQETITKRCRVCNPHKSSFPATGYTLQVPEPLNKNVTFKHATRSVWEDSMIVMTILKNFDGHFNAESSLLLSDGWLG